MSEVSPGSDRKSYKGEMLYAIPQHLGGAFDGEIVRGNPSSFPGSQSYWLGNLFRTNQAVLLKNRRELTYDLRESRLCRDFIIPTMIALIPAKKSVAVAGSGIGEISLFIIAWIVPALRAPEPSRVEP